MEINSKHYDFSLDGSEILVIKRALNLALCLSHPYNDDVKRVEIVAQLCELFNDKDGDCNVAYHIVSNFNQML